MPIGAVNSQTCPFNDIPYMKYSSFLKVFIIGLGISFIGTLPLGVLNLTALKLSVTVSEKAALMFSVGALIVEMVYVYVSLKAIGIMSRHPLVFKYANWLAFLLLIAFSFNAFWHAFNMEESLMNPSHDATLNSWGIAAWPLIGGMMMSAINPMQIPFWLGWSTVLLQRQILINSLILQLFYIFGIGAGTFIGNLVFIFGGKWLTQNMGGSQQTLNFVLGAVFLLAALLQGWKWYKPGKNALNQL